MSPRASLSAFVTYDKRRAAAAGRGLVLTAAGVATTGLPAA